jgi:hypothetical protein
MALKTLAPDAARQFGLEDVFARGSADTLAWVTGWRKLPHLKADVQALFDYPQQFAEDIFARIERALARCVSGMEAAGVRAGRLFVGHDNQPETDAGALGIADLPVHYVCSSDREVVAAQKAVPCDEPHILSDRREGRCVLSYRTAGGWVAISKAILTEVLGAGRDVRIAGLPREAAGVLKLVCPDLVVLYNPGLKAED